MDIEIPKFSIYGENDPAIQENIQKTLPWRSWDKLNIEEKQIALKQLENDRFVSFRGESILRTIYDLNHKYLRKLYGKNLHYMPPSSNHYDKIRLALDDFYHIFLNEK